MTSIQKSWFSGILKQELCEYKLPASTYKKNKGLKLKNADQRWIFVNRIFCRIPKIKKLNRKEKNLFNSIYKIYWSNKYHINPEIMV